MTSTEGDREGKEPLLIVYWREAQIQVCGIEVLLRAIPAESRSGTPKRIISPMYSYSLLYLLRQGDSRVRTIDGATCRIFE